MISDIEKKELRTKLEQYNLFKIEAKKLISLHKRETERLEREILESIPSTPNGKRICKLCDIKSMTCVGREQPYIPRNVWPILGDHIYVCEICGNRELYII